MGRQGNIAPKPSKAKLMLEALKGFNRKERHHVIETAVTGAPLTLSDQFREQLEKALGLTIPDSAYVAMDYHLNWIAAAQHMAARGSSVSAAPGKTTHFENYPGKRVSPILQGNQQDTDLLVAYESEGRVVLVMIEAKADSKWNDQQISSKAKRLGNIFQKKSPETLVDPYFVFLGPNVDSLPVQQVLSWLPTTSRWIFSRDEESIAYLSMKPGRKLYRPYRVATDDSGEYLGFRVDESKAFVPDDTEKLESDG